MNRTVDQIIKQVHRTYEGDVDYPDFEDDETQLYIAHLKDSIREWADRFPNYREAFAKLSDAVDGAKVTAVGISEYATPANFVRPANFVTVGTKKLTYIPPQEMELRRSSNLLDEWFSVIGSPAGYKIVVSPTPGAGSVIDYPYYRTLTEPTTTLDIVDVSRPLFCVYYILSKLYLDDPFNKDLAVMYEEKMDMQERLERVALARTPHGTPNRVSDIGYMRFGSGFGTTSNDDGN